MWLLGRTWLNPYIAERESYRCERPVLRTQGVAVTPCGRSRSISRGCPALGPRAEWAGTTAPRSQGALRPAAPGAGGYKWSGGCPSRLSPPRVAAVSVAFGLSKPEAKKKKLKKNSKKPQKPLKKKKRRKEEEKRKGKEKKKKKRTRQQLVLGARGEVTSTASGLPVRRRLSVRPVVSRPPGPARPCTPLRRVAAPRPGWPHHVSALPFAGTRKDLVSPFSGRCNCKPPGARGLYLSRNACPQGRCERSIWLPLENCCPLCKGIHYFNFYFLSSKPGQLEGTNSRRGPYCF